MAVNSQIYELPITLLHIILFVNFCKDYNCYGPLVTLIVTQGVEILTEHQTPVMA